MTIILDISDKIDSNDSLFLHIIPSIEREFFIFQPKHVTYSFENEKRFGKITDIKSIRSCNLSHVKMIRSNSWGVTILHDEGNRLFSLSNRDKHCVELDPIFRENVNLTIFMLYDKFYSIQRNENVCKVLLIKVKAILIFSCETFTPYREILKEH